MNFALDAVETLIKASINVGDGFHPVPLRSETEARPYASLYEQIVNAEVQLDLYEEFTFAMLGKTVGDGLSPVPFSVGDGDPILQCEAAKGNIDVARSMQE